MKPDERDQSTSEELVLKTCTVSHLCVAVGVPCAAADPQHEELVSFVRGSGHRTLVDCDQNGNDQMHYYVDLERLEGATREQRMRAALEVLVSILKSQDAIRFLSEAGFLDRRDRCSWPESARQPESPHFR